MNCHNDPHGITWMYFVVLSEFLMKYLIPQHIRGVVRLLHCHTASTIPWNGVQGLRCPITNWMSFSAVD